MSRLKRMVFKIKNGAEAIIYERGRPEITKKRKIKLMYWGKRLFINIFLIYAVYDIRENYFLRSIFR